jgi:subtilisin family serine protease
MVKPTAPGRRRIRFFRKFPIIQTTFVLLTFILVGALSLSAQEQTPATVVTFSANSEDGPAYHPGHVLVKFKGEAGPRVIPTRSPKAALAAYRNDSSVEYAEPDYIVTADTTTPTDPLWSQQWDMAKIAAPQAWDTQVNSRDVIVAVLDTGIDYKHPDLQANLWTNPANGSHGFTCLNGSCTAGGQDDYGHGTHVAGTIGASANNGQGMAGINWSTQLLSCKFMDANGSGAVSDAVLCFNQILSLKQQGYNIRVTSNSWGGGGYSQALKDAMAAVEAAGIVNVVAAGNSAVNVDIAPAYPGAYDNRGLISVLASDSADAGAYFTNFGVGNVDIAAPGVSTWSTVPTGTCAMCDPSGYRPASGTSMATPHVSGVLAAMFHLNPNLTAYQARDVLLDPSSYDAVSEERAAMTSTGGRLNFWKAIHSPQLTAPVLNNFPTITGVSNISATAGSTVSLSVSVADPDNDPLRTLWAKGSANAAPGALSLWLLGSMYDVIFPTSNGNSVTFQAPALGYPAVASYAASVTDNKGGSATALAYASILPTTSSGLPPTGTLTVSPLSGPVGTTVTATYAVSDPEGGQVAWDLWQTGPGGGSGHCCQTGTSSLSLPINLAGAYRITVQAVDQQLNFSNRQSVVVHIGGATGTPPIANAVFDKLSGVAPLTVNVDMRSSVDPDGTIQQYFIECTYGGGGTYAYGPTGSCVYDTPGSYWIFLKVKDNDGLWDAVSVYAVVLPPGSDSSPSPVPPPASSTIVIRETTMGGTASFDFATTGSSLSNFSLTTPSAGSTVSKTFSNLSPAASDGSRTINQSTLPAGWQFTSLNCSSLSGSTISVSGTVATISSLVSGDTVTCDYTDTLPTQPTNPPSPTNPANPPTVSLTSPVDGTVARGSLVTMSAAVTAGTNPVARVDFLLNGAVKCSDLTAPYTCNWNVPNAAGKKYTVQAVAYDITGVSGKSATVTVTTSR